MPSDNVHPVAASSAKRSRAEMEAGSIINSDDSSSEDDFGPALPSANIPTKKRRKLPYERLYVAALPTSTRYSKSLMHREQICFSTFTPDTDFLITSSIDGVVKFWKKVTGGIEFVKEFRAHNAAIVSVSVSFDGRSFATAGLDKTIKIFDVVNFDLLAVLNLESDPRCVCWVHGTGASLPLLAVSMKESSTIWIYDGRGENEQPLHTLKNIHRKPVTLMAFNNAYNCVISADESGMLEYWRPSAPFEKPDNVFEMKSSTSLFEFKKAKAVPSTLTLSPSGHQFATYSVPDRKIRVFEFVSGKLYRTYDESLAALSDIQQTSAEDGLYHLEEKEFARRLATERDLDQNPQLQQAQNVIFDASGYFIIYGSLVGAKVINIFTNRVAKIYGRDEPFRPINFSLYQGQPEKKGFVTVEMAASDNPLLQEAEARDAMLVSTGAGKVRFYMFTNDDNINKSDRDTQNEKPRDALSKKRKAEELKRAESGTSTTIHTTYGDIKIVLFPAAAPKAVENFTTHARNGFYNNIIFHRIIRKFMIQTGDPLGDGTGGESIWGKDFEDEFGGGLKHDKPYTVSMANAGPNTNASQFFITTERTPWLDGKHTIFGRVVAGMDVVHQIENAKVHKEKPVEDIKIINMTVD